jgi:spore coat polysaccharide biosynthesis protein SpsF
MSAPERFAALVQARMGSTRLPGKVMLPLAGRAAILRVVDRLRAVHGLDGFAVITPDTAEDQPLVRFLEAERVPVFAWDGPPADLLGRYIAAARALAADGILMVDSDCPLFDPDTASRMIAALRAAPDAEYVRIAPYSIEGGVACLRRSTFLRIDAEGAAGPDREHATLRILREPERFRIADIAPDPAFADPADAHRFWLDTRADHEFLERVFARLARFSAVPDLRDVVALLRREPALRQINAHVRQNNPLADSVPAPAQASAPGPAPAHAQAGDAP